MSGWKFDRPDHLEKRVPSKFFNAITRKVSGLALHDFNSGIKAYTREAARSLYLYGELHRYIPILAHAQGFRITEVPTHTRVRKYGETKYRGRRYLRGFFDLLTIAFLTKYARRPLHLFGGIGLSLGAIGSVILLYLVGVKVVTHQAIGTRPLLTFGVFFVLVGLQLLFLAYWPSYTCARQAAKTSQSVMNGMAIFRSPKVRKATVVVVLILVVLFCVQLLSRTWSSISTQVTSPNYAWLVFGIFATVIFFVARIIGWHYLLRTQGHPQTLKNSGRLLMFSEITRYIPGNVWSVLGRVVQGQSLGIPTGTSFYLTVVDILGLLTSSLIVGGVLAAWSSVFPLWLRLSAGLGLVIGIAMLFAVNRMARPLNWLLRKLRRSEVAWHLPVKNFFWLLCWQGVAWLGFGVGGYACSHAFLNLSPSAGMAIVAALPLSWFIGYVSFLTPSGLGVREVALAGLLQPVLGSTGVLIAGISRLSSMLVEFLLTLGYAASYVRRLWRYAWQYLRRPTTIVVMMITAFILYFSIITVVMNQKVITAHLDLGNMDQVVWNTSHGRFFQFTDPYSTNNLSRYAHHADIILVLFAPLYWIYPSANILLVTQVFIVGLGAWFVFRLARKVLGHDWLAAVLALAYLFYPTLQYAVMFDFHAVTLAATFALGMVLALQERRWRWFTLYAVLFVMCKEELALMVVTLGLLVAWRDRAVRKPGLLMAGFAFVYFILTYFVIMPHARQGMLNTYAMQYDAVGTTPRQLLQTLLHNPRSIASRIFGSIARHMYAGILGPVALLALASPLWLLLAWPDLFINLFNNRLETHLIIYHYQVVIGAFAFIATVFGLAAMHRRYNVWWTAKIHPWLKLSLYGFFAVVLVGLTAVESIRLSPMPYSVTPDNRVFWKAPMAGVIRSAAAAVPVEAKVSATNTVGAQLAHREYIFEFPIGVDQSDYIFVLLAQPGTPEWLSNHVAAEALAKDVRFTLIEQVKNFSVYKRK